MIVEKIPLERLRFPSSRSFDEVLELLSTAIGRPDMAALTGKLGKAESFSEFADLVHGAVGSSDLLEFLRIDLGAALRKDPQIESYRLVRIITGNPLIMKEMTRYVPDAGSYAPVTLLVYEREGRVCICYDSMASFLAPYASAEALKVANELDAKIIELLESAC